MFRISIHRSGGLFPGDVLIERAIDALEIAGVPRSSPLDYSGLRETYPPEIEFRGRTAHLKSHTALRIAAMAHGGVVADLDECTSSPRQTTRSATVIDLHPP